jgi:activator of Hsp90 ATPase-like protein
LQVGTRGPVRVSGETRFRGRTIDAEKRPALVAQQLQFLSNVHDDLAGGLANRSELTRTEQRDTFSAALRLANLELHLAMHKGRTMWNQDLTTTAVLPGGRTIDESMAAVGRGGGGSSSTSQQAPLVIRKVLLVRTPVALAFDYFTHDIDEWWPVSARSAGCGLECRSGGRIYEIGADDGMHVWGHVTDWLPPLHLRLAWTRDQPDDSSTEVQIDFSANGTDRTRIELSHQGWKPHQMKLYIDYRKYWDTVMINGYQDYVRHRHP